MSSLEIKTIQHDDIKKTALAHERVKLDATGELARHLLVVFAQVGVSDGVSSSGRQLIRPLEPVEIVARAVATAELAMKSFGEKGWIAYFPPLEDLLADDTSSAGF